MSRRAKNNSAVISMIAVVVCGGRACQKLFLLPLQRKLYLYINISPPIPPLHPRAYSAIQCNPAAYNSSQETDKILFLALNRKINKGKGFPAPHSYPRVLSIVRSRSHLPAGDGNQGSYSGSGTRFSPSLRPVSFLRVPESAAHSRLGCVCAMHKMKANLGTDTQAPHWHQH